MEIREARPEEYRALGNITVEAYQGLDPASDPNSLSNLGDDYLGILRDVSSSPRGSELRS
ncbi:MAG: hypothetical protein GEU71_17800 [Actinobacteria bacterium]|nr:hypothetical protein [Actinomycetota bacterium]